MAIHHVDKRLKPPKKSGKGMMKKSKKRKKRAYVKGKAEG